MLTIRDKMALKKQYVKLLKDYIYKGSPYNISNSV